MNQKVRAQNESKEVHFWHLGRSVFLVHERGIEIGLKSQEDVRTMVPPTMKRELQQLISKINFVRRFISNLSGRIEPSMELVKIRANEEFR
jgi:hypothetical protein